MSERKKLLDLVYIYPGGVRTGSHLLFFGKSAFLKHPSEHTQKNIQMIQIQTKIQLYINKYKSDGMMGEVAVCHTLLMVCDNVSLI